ncbi:Pff1p NDAI_0A07520 [Naumovozyma dairenensis CBS 421]|uniref:Peptide hydrolase n=1 Tax=Naumovozyma dairenensis (strain ATCC 10597 / BCRC 20456 / CBS 421 / NBRC 0211 / NRRL Y-12639) TaxID=1071378 RepID=G0W518_NAUDC|nr:hypothetical protein NDAI_0A07520 [Naumovozyma dairenensis CBS 421]CCD22906.1 hypothetical protein NDAI_0A07520 [Naumovozyma dairenensis CBS 421]
MQSSHNSMPTLKSIFRFRKTNVSFLFQITICGIFLLYVYDQTRYKYTLPSQSEKVHQRLLQTAWSDLQNITLKPHPYTSRDNDRVHDYILERAMKITQKIEYANISDDYETQTDTFFRQPDVFNLSSTRTRVIYFQSSNIIVKLEGKDKALPGLLLSSHFDSVPTSTGATDDGKGIASLLALLEYFCQKQPERTLIFNFNNNEEFGLLGASVFFEHPWSKLVHYFLNLEGTGVGGKAVLFRTSDVSTAQMYKEAVLKQPFGNSVYQQGFYNRYIHSETDYKVYEENGLRGWDIAFYKPRALYHTVNDSISYTSREALWHMLHTSLQLSNYVAFNNEDPHAYTPAIYFDIVGYNFFVINSKSLFALNCILLVAAPVIILVLQLLRSRKNSSTNRVSLLLAVRLPFSLAITCIILKITESALFQINPFISSRNHLSPLITFGAEFLFINYLLLTLFETLSPSSDFKRIALGEILSILWVLLLSLTYRMHKNEYRDTGIYPFTILYVCILMGILFDYFAKSLKQTPKVFFSREVDGVSGSSNQELHDGELEAAGAYTSDVERASPTNSDNSSPHTANQTIPAFEPDERAPLLETNAHYPVKEVNTIPKKPTNYSWALQFLLTVPIGIFIMFNSFDLILDALNQTSQESLKSTSDVLNISLLGGILVVLPVIPFVYKFNVVTAIALFLTFSIGAIQIFFSSPFTIEAPLKVRFSQDLKWSNGAIESVVHISGRQGFLEPLIHDLPSVKREYLAVDCEDKYDGNEVCSYSGELPNPIDTYNSNFTIDKLFSIDVLKNDRNSKYKSPYEPINAEVLINVVENRACTILFTNPLEDKSSPVKQIQIFADENNNTDVTDDKIIRWRDGIDELQLHKLDFEKKFYHIGIQWYPKILNDNESNSDSPADIDDNALNLRVICYWGEYDSESIVNGKHKKKIPAYDELLTYAPLNYSISNLNKGLITMERSIEL